MHAIPSGITESASSRKDLQLVQQAGPGIGRCRCRMDAGEAIHRGSGAAESWSNLKQAEARHSFSISL